MVSYVLTFMLGTCFGGFIAVFAMACCIVASDHSIRNATEETEHVSVGGTDE